jgi:hypothetical protein
MRAIPIGYVQQRQRVQEMQGGLKGKKRRQSWRRQEKLRRQGYPVTQSDYMR